MSTNGCGSPGWRYDSLRALSNTDPPGYGNVDSQLWDVDGNLDILHVRHDEVQTLEKILARAALSRSTEEERVVRRAAVVDRELERGRARGVSRQVMDRERGVAKRQGLAILEDHVAVEGHPERTVRIARSLPPVVLDELPVLLERGDAGARERLNLPGPAVVIEVTVRDQDVPNVLGIEAGLPHVLDHVIDVGLLSRVDENEPVARGDEPDRDEPGAHVKEVVEHLDGGKFLIRLVVSQAAPVASAEGLIPVRDESLRTHPAQICVEGCFADCLAAEVRGQQSGDRQAGHDESSEAARCAAPPTRRCVWERHHRAALTKHLITALRSRARPTLSPAKRSLSSLFSTI